MVNGSPLNRRISGVSSNKLETLLVVLLSPIFGSMRCQHSFQILVQLFDNLEFFMQNSIEEILKMNENFEDAFMKMFISIATALEDCDSKTNLRVPKKNRGN